MDGTTLKYIFSGVAITIFAVGIISLFLMMPNSVQKRITKADTAGWGIAAFGALCLLACLLFCSGTVTPMYRTYDLSTFLAEIFACMAGAGLGLGIFIGLPDKITDPFLDQRNIWKLLIVLIVILTAVFFLLR